MRGYGVARRQMPRVIYSGIKGVSGHAVLRVDILTLLCSSRYMNSQDDVESSKSTAP